MNTVASLAIISLSVMTVIALDSQLGLAGKVTSFAAGNGGA